MGGAAGSPAQVKGSEIFGQRVSVHAWWMLLCAGSDKRLQGGGVRVSEKVEKQPGLAERRHPQRKTFNGEEEGEEPAEPGRAEGEELRG